MVDDTDLGVIELDQNLADVEKPPELPAGFYVGEIQDVQKATSDKGNDYFKIKFVIPPEEIPADIQGDFEDGAILFWNRQIVPTAKDRRALFNLKKFVESLGLDTGTTSIDPNEWMGCQARLRVRLGTYNGERRAEIQAVEPLEAQAPVARGKPQPARRAPAEAEEPEAAPAPRRTTARRR
jgi:hypothetical protein